MMFMSLFIQAVNIWMTLRHDSERSSNLGKLRIKREKNESNYCFNICIAGMMWKGHIFFLPVQHHNCNHPQYHPRCALKSLVLCSAHSYVRCWSLEPTVQLLNEQCNIKKWIKHPNGWETGFIPRGGSCKTSNSASLSQQVQSPTPLSNISHRKLSNWGGKSPHIALSSKINHWLSHQPPTFLLLEGLDGARVVHHCDVQLVSSADQIPYYEEQNCGIHEKVWRGGVGVLPAPMLPRRSHGRCANPQQHLSQLRMLKPTSPPLPPPHPPPPPSSTAVVMVTGGRGGPEMDTPPPFPSVLIYWLQISCGKLPGAADLKWTDKNVYWLDRQLFCCSWKLRGSSGIICE